jgi:hypothetical protein
MKRCNCKDWEYLRNSHSGLFDFDVSKNKYCLNWMELTEEKGYTQVHRYGVYVSYCPMCGGKIKLDEVKDNGRQHKTKGDK